MKKLLIAVVAVLVSATTFAQGTVQFNNRVAGVLDAPVSRPGGAGAGLGIKAELVQLGAGGAVTVLAPVTIFRSTSAAAAYYVTPVDAIASGVGPGGSATFQMRAYDATATSYEAAVTAGMLYGFSNEVTVNNLGGTPAGGGLPITPPTLNGLQGFTLVPEPSTIALGVLGAAALLFRRRK